MVLLSLLERVGRGLGHIVVVSHHALWVGFRNLHHRSVELLYGCDDFSLIQKCRLNPIIAPLFRVMLDLVSTHFEAEQALVLSEVNIISQQYLSLLVVNLFHIAICMLFRSLVLCCYFSFVA